MWLIGFLIVGFVAGLIARMLVSGAGPRGCIPTTLLGMAGSFVGGFLGYVLFDHNLEAGRIQTSGVFGSIIGAIVLLWLYRAFAK
jgi:uncharacterized membrane protein YeaQ/YmgE (transglycosylase-associated protein family)